MVAAGKSIHILKKNGSEGSSIQLNPRVFQAPVNQRLLKLVTTAYGRNQRAGTSSTKTRKEVRGGGKKPWRQKGTGRARAGSNRSPIWRGGGTTFGPKPRSYRVNLPKTMRIEALRSALSLRFKEKGLLVLEDFDLKSNKTKEFAGILKSLKLTKKVLCVADKPSSNLKLASRNIPNATLVGSEEVTAYDILRKSKLILSKNSVSILEKRIEQTPKKIKATPDSSKSKQELAEVK